MSGASHLDRPRTVKVLRRLGMRSAARLVQNEWFKGEWTTEVDFAMLADEWRAQQ
ncbi:GNAT family protein [Asanoa sp. NPDC049518]|uniref:GNAT family protein n=1 Tax=unclassified Asanoa TaxID=2685164 RepID=UPI00341E36B1